MERALTLHENPLGYRVCLFLFCADRIQAHRLANSDKSASPSSVFAVLARLTLLIYGGSTIAAALLGVPPFVLTANYPLLILVAAWCLDTWFEFYRKVILPSYVGELALWWGSSLIRASIVHSWGRRATDVLGAENLVGIVLIGFIAGCGGSLASSMDWDYYLSRPGPPALLNFRVAVAAMSFALPADMVGVHRHAGLAVWFLVTGWIPMEWWMKLLVPFRNFTSGTEEKTGKLPKRRRRSSLKNG